jgi:hypothetical protein
MKNLEISWNNTIEGKQYFVSINNENKLEYCFDDVNPLVGNGKTFELLADLKQEKWMWEELEKIFGIDNVRQIYALVFTLREVSSNDIKNRSAKFYAAYQKKLEQVLDKRIFGKAE